MLHPFVDEEEGNGPDEIGDDETVKPGMQFFWEIDMLLCLVKEEVSRDHCEAGGSEVDPEVNDISVERGIYDEQINGPVIDQDNMDDKKADLINVQ
jgi:hypothetical protein